MNDAALPLPPPALRFMNEDDERFLATRDGIVSDLLDLCGLRTDGVVLDLGSGYGRVAMRCGDGATAATISAWILFAVMSSGAGARSPRRPAARCGSSTSTSRTPVTTRRGACAPTACGSTWQTRASTSWSWRASSPTCIRAMCATTSASSAVCSSPAAAPWRRSSRWTRRGAKPRRPAGHRCRCRSSSSPAAASTASRIGSTRSVTRQLDPRRGRRRRAADLRLPPWDVVPPRGRAWISGHVRARAPVSVGRATASEPGRRHVPRGGAGVGLSHG